MNDKSVMAMTDTQEDPKANELDVARDRIELGKKLNDALRDAYLFEKAQVRRYQKFLNESYRRLDVVNRGFSDLQTALRVATVDLEKRHRKEAPKHASRPGCVKCETIMRLTDTLIQASKIR